MGPIKCRVNGRQVWQGMAGNVCHSLRRMWRVCDINRILIQQLVVKWGEHTQLKLIGSKESKNIVPIGHLRDIWINEVSVFERWQASCLGVLCFELHMLFGWIYNTKKNATKMCSHVTPQGPASVSVLWCTDRTRGNLWHATQLPPASDWRAVIDALGWECKKHYERKTLVLFFNHRLN